MRIKSKIPPNLSAKAKALTSVPRNLDVPTDIETIHIPGSNTYEKLNNLLKTMNEEDVSFTRAQLEALHEGESECDKRVRYSRVKASGGFEVFQPNSKCSVVYTKTPPFIQNCTMRDYQIDGLNWLIRAQKNGRNVCLGDEMGLGKTIQTIALLAFNQKVLKCKKKFLIVVPLSTLHNWKSEFEKFAPSVNVAVFHCLKAHRKQLIDDIIKPAKFDVGLATYESAIIFKAHLQRIDWEYVVIDEAQRIKCPDRTLFRELSVLITRHRLLLTGTPFQNDSSELWSILAFLQPAIFCNLMEFFEYFSSENLRKMSERVELLQNIIQPFLLRRVKHEVEKSIPPKREYRLYVGLSELQQQFYKAFINKSVATNEQGEVKLSHVSHTLMRLRQTANHPFIFPEAEPSGPPYVTDERIVTSSGKMILLDQMLKKFKAEGSRVLIFSQFVSVLNILEDYCDYRKYPICRIDGSRVGNDRQKNIMQFNKVNSKKFVFLMTTRAGGIGINLASADVVILYDSDFNPQMDLQAIARSHRIGQTKEVRVFRLISKGTVDEYLHEIADLKAELGSKIIVDGNEKVDSKLKIEKMKKILMDSHRKVQTGLETLGIINFDKLLNECDKTAMEEVKKKEKIVANGGAIFTKNFADYRLNPNKDVDGEILKNCKEEVEKEIENFAAGDSEPVQPKKRKILSR
ncbi:unnamed protein product [Caenorhabditis bovis]|uniref:Uncharacterized protein n=1 Tax=Caenorhabditis bovis TaxID=2654633 RepID=A0A8S1EPY0_9PELO|nr:unnamed protein product [Caenorhabditis bovis]